MALQVWLPLNGDLKNKGCADVTVTNASATVDANGKIGSCVKVVDEVDLNYAPDFGTGSFSFCGWFKFNKSEITTKVSTLTINATRKQPTGSLIGNQSYGGIGIAWNANNVYADGVFNSMSIMGTIRTPTISTRNTGSFAVSFDTWIHIALLWDYETKKLSIYKDGIHYASTTTPDFSDAVIRSLNINYSGVYGGNGPGTTIPFRTNDVRIYDHCLSPTEVKEISRGLVLHYKLNHLPINNLIPFNLSNDTYTISDYANRTTGSISNKIYHVDGYQSETSADTSFSIKSNTFLILNADSDYYLSFYCKAANSLSTLFFGVSGQAYTGLMDSSNKHFYPSSQVTLGHNYEGYVVLKIHTGSDTQYKINIGFDVPNLYGVGSYMEFSNIMLTAANPDLESTYFDNTILDSSGYNNNSTIVGNLTISEDTPRYKNCIAFTNSSYLRSIDKVATFLPTDALTVNLWIKYSTWGNPISCTQGGGWNFEKNSNGIEFPLYVSGVGYKTANSGITSATLANSYHMLTGTFDKTNVKIYIDGELKATTATNSTNGIGYANNYLFISAEAKGDTITPESSRFVGNISDVRIYATALSEEDVMQLYEVSTKIDNTGNIHSYEFDEYEEGRELLILNLTNPRTSTTTTHLNYSEEGVEFTEQGESSGSKYIEINPTSHKYIYDFTVSIAAGNQFYIGFERYDADKTARSGNACTYVISTKPTTDVIKKRYRGTVDLSTDGVNPCKYIRLRILNGWSGSDSDSTKKATIHSMSLREIPENPINKTKITKTGVFKTDLLLENNSKAEIEKNLDTIVNQFIEI